MKVGDTLGAYRILDKLGEGGMGEVYRARDEYLDREVAIKVLPTDRLDEPSAVDRFFREARAASALNHPHIVTIHGAGRVEAGHYMVMELVHGRTLRALVGAPADTTTLRDLGSQIARALAVAHEAGIVHRDVKPENVMVRQDGYVKVLDFGLARLEPRFDRTDVADTGWITQRVVGTPRYLSPERVRGDAGGSATDVFSLGIVLYELATGRHPFSAGSHYDVVLAICSDDPVPPSRLNPELPADLNAMILHMLDKEPSRRPSAADVARTLAAQSGALRVPAPAKVDAPRIVGRSREQAELRRVFSQSVEGRGFVMCVTGEPGIGKSTLVEDFLAEQINLGVACRIARGRCSERLAGTEAYLPILDALESLLRAPGSDGSSTARLLKTVAPLWYGQLASLSDASSGGGAGEASRERLKRELVAFLEEAARTQPFVLFFDDVHWADVSTVDLLAYVASRFESMRILVIVTYRPEELLRDRHPFLRVKQDLQARGCCVDLPLNFLKPIDLDAYLDVEFTDHRFPPTFAKLIYEKTEGNPLFMADVLWYLRDQGVLSKQSGHWSLSRAVPDIARALPESVRSMIQRKIDLLGEEDRRVLLAASVQGYEFDAAIVAQVLDIDAADVEERLDRLDRIHAFVKTVREREFPDHTVTVRYRFVHVLYQNMLYATLTHARKVSYALGVARRLETAYGGQASEVAAELAVLYQVGREFARAADCFRVAAQHAAHVFAYHEAVLLAQRGIDALETLANGPERKRRELALLLAMGVPVIVAKGFGDARVGEVYDRALALASALDDATNVVEILWGLGNFHLVTLSLDKAYEASSELLQRATAARGEGPLMQAHHLLGLVSYHRGDFRSTLEHTNRVALAYDRERSRRDTATYGFDPRVASGSYAACAFWTTGRPDRALEEVEVVLALARELGHAHTLAYGLFFASVLHQFRREWPIARRYADELLEVSSEKGLLHFLNASQIFIGLDEAQAGHRETGIEQMQQALIAYRATGAETSRPRVNAQIAEQLGRAGRVREAITLVEEEIASLGSARFHLSELHRVRGDLLAADGREPGAVEACFQSALEVARAQAARSFELRAAMSLYRYRQGRQSAGEARHLLAGLYDSFDEGHESGDLEEAQALLAVESTSPHETTE